MDIWTKKKRSAVMRQIKGKDTKPELILRSGLFRMGLRYRVHKTGLPGRPDIVLPKYRSVIFVNGCFWHFHSKCKEGKIPNTNQQFWRDKLTRNRNRDKQNIKALRQGNWKVFVVWECEIEKALDATLTTLVKALKT